MEKKIINNQGITLVALIITIIVMLILAGVSISLVVGENGVLSQAQESGKASEKSEIREKILLSFIYNTEGKNAGKLMYDETIEAITNSLSELAYNDVDIKPETTPEAEEDPYFPIIIKVVGKNDNYQFKLSNNGKIEEQTYSSE